MNGPRTGPSWQDTTIIGSLHFAFVLGERTWKLSLGDGARAQPLHSGRQRYDRSLHGDRKAKVRCHLAADTPVRSC